MGINSHRRSRPIGRAPRVITSPPPDNGDDPQSGSKRSKGVRERGVRRGRGRDAALARRAADLLHA